MRLTIIRSLREFIAKQRQRRLLKLFGKLEWQEFDYKAARGRE